MAFSAPQVPFEGMVQTYGDGGPDAPRASPQDVAAGPTASSSSGLGFILESGESKDNDSGWRKEWLDSLLKDSAMVKELITTNLRVGWYGHDSVVDASGEYSLEAESNDDSDLWNPPQQIEECLICFVPMPLAYNHYTYFECCGKRICDACCAETNRALKITNSKRKEKDLPLLEESCAFCRTIYECEDEISHLEKRVQKGDVDAMVNLAFSYADGDHGLIKNEDKRLELLPRRGISGILRTRSKTTRFGQLTCRQYLGQYGTVSNKAKIYIDSIEHGGSIAVLRLA